MRESLQKQGSLMLATLQQLKEVKTMGGQRKDTRKAKGRREGSGLKRERERSRGKSKNSLAHSEVIINVLRR